MKVAEHGDCSARERLMIVGFHRIKVGQVAEEFVFPHPLYDHVRYHTCESIAVPDGEVPAQYWRYDEPTMLPVTMPVPLTMHKIARSGPGMGHSDLPALIQGWDGLFNTQTTHNGGGRRPQLSWRPGQPLGRTRLTVPVETVRAASLPDDYLAWCLSFHTGEEQYDDRHLRECVNMGIPVRTVCDLNECIRTVLIRAGVPFDVGDDGLLSQAEQVHRQHCALEVSEGRLDPLISDSKVKRIRVDTGASCTFMYTDIEPFMEDVVPANCVINVAKKGSQLRGNFKGKLRCHVLNMAANPVLPVSVPFELHPTTVPELSQELMSLDDYYCYGRYNVLLRQQDYQDGVSELYRAPSPGIPEARVPLSFDWQGKGGWWMYYIPAVAVDGDDMRLCANVMQDDILQQTQEVKDVVQRAMLTVAQVQVMHEAMMANPNVREVISRHEDTSETTILGPMTEVESEQVPSTDVRTHMVVGASQYEREILGVKAGMKSSFKRMSGREFHERFMHIGTLPRGQKFKVCQMAKGIMRLIFYQS